LGRTRSGAQEIKLREFIVLQIAIAKFLSRSFDVDAPTDQQLSGAFSENIARNELMPFWEPRR
jgi:hypothetical protein